MTALSDITTAKRIVDQLLPLDLSEFYARNTLDAHQKMRAQAKLRPEVERLRAILQPAAAVIDADPSQLNSIGAILFEVQALTRDWPSLVSQAYLKDMVADPNACDDMTLVCVTLMMARVAATSIPSEVLHATLELTERSFSHPEGRDDRSQTVQQMLHELWAVIARLSLPTLVGALGEWSRDIGWNRVSSLFLADLMVHAAAVQPEHISGAMDLLKEIAARDNDPGVKEVPPSSYINTLHRLATPAQQVSAKTVEEGLLTNRLLTIGAAVLMSLLVSIGTYRASSDPSWRTSASSTARALGYEFCVVALYTFSLVWIIVAICGWAKTFSLLGLRAIRHIPRMLQLRDASRFTWTHGTKRNPWWVNSLFHGPLVGLLFFLAQRFDSSILYALATAGCMLFVRLLFFGRPPAVVLLGPSTPVTLSLQNGMNNTARNSLVVSLLDTDRADSSMRVGSWAYTGTSFRTYTSDPRTWFTTVQDFSRMAGFVVLDARFPSQPVLQEVQWILKSDYTYKLVCIIGEDGNAPILDWMDIPRTELIERGVLLVSESDLYSMVRAFTRSGASLPTPSSPAAQRWKSGGEPPSRSQHGYQKVDGGRARGDAAIR